MCRVAGQSEYLHRVHQSGGLWRTWRKSLWLIQVFAALGIGLIVSGATHGSLQAGYWLTCAVVAFPLVVAAFAAFPQIVFKPQERTLEVGSAGWSSKIGRLTGSRAWAEVASIDEEVEAVMIRGTNGNALLVPSRAFESPEQKHQFVRDVRMWHGSGT
jgi:hypothetical protein